MFERSYLQNIIINAPIGIITTSLDRTITFLSEEAKRACGIDAASGATPRRVEDLVAEPSKIEAWLEPVAQGTQQRVTAEFESAVGDRPRTISFTATLLRDDAYAPIGLLLMCEDVTARRETEKKYHSVLQSCLDGVAILQGDRFLEVNPAMAHFAGRSVEECRGLTWQSLVHPDSIDTVADYTRRAAQGDPTVPTNYDCFGVTPHGEKRCLNVTVSPLLPEKGLFSLLIRDLTEQRQLEQRLQESRHMESLGLLAGGVAHDFNNLLSGVLGYASLIRRSLETGDTLAAYAEAIEHASLRAKDLTAQLLAFAQKGRYEARVLDLNQSIAEVLRLIQMRLDKRVSLDMELDPSLQPIQADPTQIQQVVGNLCTNALEAMPDGGTLTVTTSNVIFEQRPSDAPQDVIPGPYVCLTVADTGLGMPDDVRNHLFQPFVSTKGSGRGLGLSAVYGTVRHHHGFLRLHTASGSGSRFEVYLPATTEQATPSPMSAEPLARGRETILVVDDEQIIRDLLEQLLEELGYRVYVAADGPTAVSIFKNHHSHIDLVLLDMVMPRMGGEETFEALRRIDPGVRVILCTGYSSESFPQRLLSSGVRGLIQKPFQLEEISAVLRRALEPQPRQTSAAPATSGE